ncbi:MAG: putative toxin-antitoxin system toxin component, PIN family [Solirubrobacterales bacterium]|nr:putative toxin-antitoxin system toxin component, PIN family [Solirubrobacterales bacterium]
MIRAVLDVNVLVSAFIGRSDRAPRQLLHAWRDGKFELVVSPNLLAELGKVLDYPKLERWTDNNRGTAWVTGLAAAATKLPDPGTEPVGFADPNDEYLIALARQSNVDVLISGDGLLRDLHVEGLTVLSPAAFLASIAPTR